MDTGRDRRVTVVASSYKEAPMVMVANGPAAYGPAKTIISLIERFRGPGLPFPLSVESLPRVSVSESLAPRTLQSLKTPGPGR